MAIDVDRARRETPGCGNVLHFNNAGAALMPSPVIDAMVGHLTLESRIGGYEAADAARDAGERVYHAAAALLNCAAYEIAVVENATRAWDMAFYSIPFAAGDRILTSVAEYSSNFIAYLQVCRRTGAQVEVVPNDEHGRISVEALRSAIDERVKVIALTHVPTNGGLVNPAVEVGRIARDAGVLYLLDACQSAGQMPLDVQQIGCDMLSATGRKFLRGPRGTGFLFVRKDLAQTLEPPLLDLHAARWIDRSTYEVRPDARRFENWETNYAAKIGLGVAADYALGWGLDSIWLRVRGLADALRTGLASVPRVTVQDLGLIRCGIVTFTVAGVTPEVLHRKLRERGINVSVSPPEYTLLDMQNRGLTAGVVRASVHYYNTEDEVDRFCHAVTSIVRVQ